MQGVKEAGPEGRKLADSGGMRACKGPASSVLAAYLQAGIWVQIWQTWFLERNQKPGFLREIF